MPLLCGASIGDQREGLSCSGPSCTPLPTSARSGHGRCSAVFSHQSAKTYRANSTMAIVLDIKHNTVVCTVLYSTCTAMVYQGNDCAWHAAYQPSWRTAVRRDIGLLEHACQPRQITEWMDELGFTSLAL